MRKIDFAIMTVSRPPHYIHDLIAALRPDLPLRLVVGSPDYEYLERYRDDPYKEIVEVPDQGWEHFHNRRMQHKACWNYWRCLKLGSTTPGAEGLVVFEDDIMPARGWEERLYEAVDQIESACKERYALALYSPRRLARTPNSRTYYVSYPTHRFYGTQAIYFPESVREEFMRFIRIYGVNTWKHNHDIMLRWYLQHMNIPLFATKPCLFQHVGEAGSGFGKFHTTKQFQSDLTVSPRRARVVNACPQRQAEAIAAQG